MVFYFFRLLMRNAVTQCKNVFPIFVLAVTNVAQPPTMGKRENACFYPRKNTCFDENRLRPKFKKLRNFRVAREHKGD